MSEDLRSYFIYFGLLIFCFVLAARADKTNNKRLIFYIALALSLISGLRKNTVGIDTINYYWQFKNLNSINAAFNHYDRGFYIIAFLLMKIKNDPYFCIFIFSLITNYLVVYRLWEFREISSYKYSILRYITIFYFFSFNCMRQFLSIAIVFYGMRYFEKGDYIKFFIYIIIASTIHISSLIAIIYIILDVFQWRKLSIFQKNSIKISFLLSPIIIFILLNLTKGRYERYFSQIRIVSWTSLALKIILFFVVVIFYYSEKKIRKENDDILHYRKMSLIYYIIGTVSILLGVFFSHAERIGYYFYIYATVYTGIAANEKRYKYLFRIIIIFIIIRSFYLNCSVQNGSMGQMPYLFNWE